MQAWPYLNPNRRYDEATYWIGFIQLNFCHMYWSLKILELDNSLSIISNHTRVDNKLYVINCPVL